ncbi:hypothetical protein AGMMS4957_18910 [Bacteroidia bacterium]|nr:hypothetical protein AGMMS4957_18910 [Bacteroidia bacterium]
MANLTYEDKAYLEKYLQMESGWVLDFGNDSLQRFVLDSIQIDIYTKKYDKYGDSKAKRIRAVWDVESDYNIGKLLISFIEYYKGKRILNPDFFKITKEIEEKCEKLSERLMLEAKQKGIVNISTSETIEKFNQEYIVAQWKKAIARKIEDPEGAITTARTLIETTCKYILDEMKVEYKDDIELPKLYKLTAEKLNLAPDQHTEQIFKQILGGCQTVVEGLGSLRNKLSDSHGKKITQSKPSSRHAELAVNLAGTMTTFLLDTYEFNKNKKITNFAI